MSNKPEKLSQRDERLVTSAAGEEGRSKIADPSLPTPPGIPKSRRSTHPLYNWFNERVGLDELLDLALDEPVPGGASYSYVFGSALLAVLLLQALSGVALLFYYTPTVDHAHTSVAYIMKEVAGGPFIRGLHVYGASAMIILLAVHVIQTFFYGSYKGQRELQWVSGVVLFFLVLGMGFTGYLLPWDQKAYFATKVGTNVGAEIPVIGSQIKLLLLRGQHLGALTLSAFFVTHVFIIPALIVLFVALHIYLLRKRGAAGPVSRDLVEIKLRTQPFYPYQVAKDLVVATGTIVLIGVVAYLFPPDLGPKANPADIHYLPRPDWYFRFLFQWLKYWPGSRAVIGIVVIPAIIILLFLLVPFIDRRPERRPWRRPLAVGIFLAILIGIVVLGGLSYFDDSHNPAVAEQMARQRQQTEEFMKAPFTPDTAGPIAVPAASPANPLVAAGQKVFQSDSCFACHGEAGVGTSAAPKLIGISQKYSSQQLAFLLRHYSPGMIKGGMPKFPFSDQDLTALVAYLESLK
ncbi:MAG: cytochrome b N-terminal domain-containing protein [Terriglobia bacterium]